MISISMCVCVCEWLFLYLWWLFFNVFCVNVSYAQHASYYIMSLQLYLTHRLWPWDFSNVTTCPRRPLVPCYSGASIAPSLSREHLSYSFIIYFIQLALHISHALYLSYLSSRHQENTSTALQWNLPKLLLAAIGVPSGRLRRRCTTLKSQIYSRWGSGQMQYMM